GRFLFAVDDGRGDVAGLGADVTIAAGGTTVEGVESDRADAVRVALQLAETFLTLRAEQGSTAWRVGELDGGITAVLDRVGLVATRRPVVVAPTGPPVGLTAQPDGRQTLVALAPLGRLDGRQVDVLVSLAGPRGVRVTPWRSVVVPDIADAPAAL